MFDLSRRTLLQTSCSLALILGMTASAKAELSISTKPTQNVTCASGVCATTAKKAVLNVTDLGNMLAAGNLSIQSGSKAQDILFDAPFSWTSSNALTLDAYRSLQFNKPVSDAGPAALTLKTNDGGTGGELSFGSKGHVAFLGASNSLTIDKHIYTLESGLPTLIADANARPSGFFALANDYDASVDGTYAGSAIATFKGEIQGLGNTISHFSIANDTRRGLVGLIGDNKGDVSNLTLASASISAEGAGVNVGALAGLNEGTLFRDRVSGKVGGRTNSNVGGLVGVSTNTISQSSSSARVTARKNSTAGGLVGFSNGTIQLSYATGDVREIDLSETKAAFLGGLVGDIENSTAKIVNSYALGSVTAQDRAAVGGLVGFDQSSALATSYSIGSLTTGNGGRIGGLVGAYDEMGSFSNCYWDIDTSGTDEGVANTNFSGVTGLTDDQLKSGLPAGFDPAVWAQSATINNGYPYLIANPPAK